MPWLDASIDGKDLRILCVAITVQSVKLVSANDSRLASFTLSHLNGLCYKIGWSTHVSYVHLCGGMQSCLLSMCRLVVISWSALFQGPWLPSTLLLPMIFS